MNIIEIHSQIIGLSESENMNIEDSIICLCVAEVSLSFLKPLWMTGKLDEYIKNPVPQELEKALYKYI